MINTESCTLFALDAATGKMRWSYYLGDPLLSTPTIANRPRLHRLSGRRQPEVCETGRAEKEEAQPQPRLHARADRDRIEDRPDPVAALGGHRLHDRSGRVGRRSARNDAVGDVVPFSAEDREPVVRVADEGDISPDRRRQSHDAHLPVRSGRRQADFRGDCADVEAEVAVSHRFLSGPVSGPGDSGQSRINAEGEQIRGVERHRRRIRRGLRRRRFSPASSTGPGRKPSPRFSCNPQRTSNRKTTDRICRGICSC